jgi:exosome complex RNA-binding protein Csl4
VAGAGAAMSGDEFRVVVTDAAGSTTSAPATLYVNSASATVRLVNISARAQVGTGSNILIPGFAISGSGSETLLIRADGPTLATAFNVSGALEAPSLGVYDATGKRVATNTGWGTNTNPSQIASIAASVGAFALPAGSADCALVASLPAGAYTVQVSGVNNTTGVALAEVYEVSSSGTRLVNISTRTQVGTGGNIIIVGFVVSGSGTEQLLVRGDGPALAQFGVPGVLAQPSLSVFDGSGASVAGNTGWTTNTNPSQLASVAASVGAFALTQGSADSAEIVNLQAGAYTMQVSGVNNTTGVALAEAYEVP